MDVQEAVAESSASVENGEVKRDGRKQFQMGPGDVLEGKSVPTEDRTLSVEGWSAVMRKIVDEFAQARGSTPATVGLCAPGLVSVDSFSATYSAAAVRPAARAVGNLRAATAVFTNNGRGWTTQGRVVFNLEPPEVLQRYRESLEPLSQ